MFVLSILTPHPLALFVQLFFIDYRVSVKVVSDFEGYASVNSKQPPGGKFSKTVKSQSPGAMFFGLISRGRAALASLILINFTLFAINLRTDHCFPRGYPDWEKIVCVRKIAEINCLPQRCI